MLSETNGATQDTSAQEPILELWRILALALIVAAGMLFVHLVVPAEADASTALTSPGQHAGGHALR